MGFLFRISDKEMLELRNGIFKDKGIPALNENGFVQSPFSTAWFGKNNLGDYTYELARLSEDSNLEIITTHISKGDHWVKIFLNIFKLNPIPESIKELQGMNGLQYALPPNSLTQMRLRIDDYKGIPLFRIKEHRIKSFNSERSLNKRTLELGNLIENDLRNIDSFVEKWHDLHAPNETDWEGNVL